MRGSDLKRNSFAACAFSPKYAFISETQYARKWPHQPVGVLRPADRVTERAGPLAARVGDEGLADLEEVVDRATARLRDELGRVARVVTLEDLEDAPRVLHLRVLLGRLPVVEAAAVAAV